MIEAALVVYANARHPTCRGCSTAVIDAASTLMPGTPLAECATLVVGSDLVIGAALVVGASLVTGVTLVIGASLVTGVCSSSNG